MALKTANMKKYQRRWYLKHRTARKGIEKVRAAVYYQKNKKKANAVSKRWHQENHERSKFLKKRWLANNQARWKSYILGRLYGITLEQFEALLRKQRGRCGVCRQKFSEGKKSTRPHVDHHHATQRVRDPISHLTRRWGSRTWAYLLDLRRGAQLPGHQMWCSGLRV